MGVYLIGRLQSGFDIHCIHVFDNHGNFFCYSCSSARSHVIALSKTSIAKFEVFLLNKKTVS